MRQKARHADWAKLGKPAAPEPAKKGGPIVIRAMPIIKKLEQELQFVGRHDKVMSHEMDALIAKASQELFGITDTAVRFAIPAGYDEDEYIRSAEWSVQMQYDRHEESFETYRLMDDQVVDYLLARGLDFRDDRGQPLRCTMIFRRQAEAVVRGIKGRLPDRGEIEVKAWESSLEAAAQAFLDGKRKRGA